MLRETLRQVTREGAAGLEALLSTYWVRSMCFVFCRRPPRSHLAGGRWRLVPFHSRQASVLLFQLWASLGGGPEFRGLVSLRAVPGLGGEKREDGGSRVKGFPHPRGRASKTKPRV